LYYFGRWGRVRDGKLEKLPGDDWWKPALKEFKERIDDIQAGRSERPKSAGDRLLVKELVDAFRLYKAERLEQGDIGQLTYNAYVVTCDLLYAQFGQQRVSQLTPQDFRKLRTTMVKRWGPVRLSNEIVTVRSIFKWGLTEKLLTVASDFGADFRKPDGKKTKKQRAELDRKHGAKPLTAAQLRTLLEAACPEMRAMILLGLNCGFGNNDIAELPLHAVDLEKGWVTYPRPKTGEPRWATLWPETVAALQAVLKERPEPASDDCQHLVFLTRKGQPWKRNSISYIGVKFRQLLEANKMYHKGRGFYDLRHVFRTVADNTLDRVAINLIMGHVNNSMGDGYVDYINPERLVKVTNYVHDWLFPPQTEGGAK
jgi:integrase